MKRAIISVTDKTGLEKFQRLINLGNWEIISTGGTYKKLQELGIPCIQVEEVTNFPEMMNGRIKTLHPNIFAGILADRSKLEHMAAIAEHGISPIDLIVVNLYDFNGNPGIEQIDIGGPSMLRAAAKNGANVVSIVNPKSYDKVISEIEEYGEVTMKTKENMAIDVFGHTSQYDTAIFNWMCVKRKNEKPIFGD